MRELRFLGNKIRELAEKRNISAENIAKLLDRPVTQIRMGLSGRAMFSYSQLEMIADYLQVSISVLLSKDQIDYSLNSVDCMNNFTNDKNREDILDLIYDYLDIRDSVNEN